MKLGPAVALIACLCASPAPAAVPQRTPAPSKPEVNQGQLENLFLAACLGDMAAGLAAKAEAECSKAIALDPRSAVAYKLRGYGYLMTRRFERAEADFRVALRLKPADAQNHAGLGQSLSGMGDYEKAVSQFALAVKLSPKMAAYHNGLCWARAGTGKHLDRALADCNHALALAPGTPGPLNSRGLVRLRMGRYRGAITDYNVSLAVRSAQPSARFGRGWARLQLGEKPQGTRDIAQARREDADIDLMFVRLGILPRSCAEAATGCPAGFPAASRKAAPSYPWLVVSLHGDPDEDFALAIEAHRLDVMVGQVADLLGRKTPVPPMPAQSHQAILDQLSRTVERFNGLLPQACVGGRIRPQQCRPFRPAWTAATDPAVAVEEAYGRIVPVWAGLCAGRAQRCPIE